MWAKALHRAISNSFVFLLVPPLKYEISITDDLNTLLADTANWDRLADGVPFRQAAWLGAWWDTFGDDLLPTVVVATDQQGDVQGILPLYRTAESRTLRMIGDGETCSDHVTVLAQPDRADEIAYAFGLRLAANARDKHHGWDLVDIDGVVEGDGVMSSFAKGLRESGSALHASSRLSVWYKPADKSWDDHLKHYGKTNRRKMRRTIERVGDSKEFQKKVAVTPGEAEVALNHVIRMHQNRWNNAGYPGSFANSRFRSFIHEAAQRFLKQGQLHVTNLVFQGNVIGGELNFIGENRIMYSYSAGYDTKYEAQEPGRVMCIAGMHELYERGLAGLDFMRGDETYKQRYATESRRLYRVRAVAPTPIPRLRHAMWATGFEVKQWMRRRTGRSLIEVQDATLLG